MYKNGVSAANSAVSMPGHEVALLVVFSLDTAAHKEENATL